MAENRSGSRKPADVVEPKTASGAEEEIDLAEIDAFLEKGLDAVVVPDSDPVSGLRAPPRRPVPQKAPAAVGASPSPAGTAKKPAPLPADAICLEVSADRVQARLKVLPSRARGMGQEDVMNALKRAGICHGVDQDAIIELVEAVGGGAMEEMSILVAEGVPPVAGEPAQVAFPALKGEALTEALRIQFRDSGLRLRELLAGGKIKEIDETCAGLPLLRPGEVAFQVVPAVQGKAGMDVFGKEMPVKAVDESVPVPGEGIKASEGGKTCVSGVFGYLAIDDQVVSVIPAVWMAPDEMSVYVLDLGSPQGPPEVEALLSQMRGMGISPLSEAGWLKGQLAQSQGRPGVILAGEGRPPEPGQDARVEMHVEVGSRAGKMMKDGSIDFRQRNFAASVEKDTLLATRTPATPGRAGKTVRGREIPANPGKDVALSAGKGVEAVTKEGQTFFYAREEGCVLNRNGALEVGPELKVSGDVDYSTGNVDFRGDVAISGSVREGFSIKATGDVVIGEGLENGAQVSSGKSVTVSKGIFGEKTRGVALGGIRAQFVQDASLRCRGDAEIGSYIYNASVRSGGGVTVHGLGDRGGIVGGEVCARTLLVVSSAGSEYGTATRLLAGVDVDQMRSLQKVDQGLNQCRTNIQMLLSAIKVSSPDPKEIGRLMATLPTSQREKARVLARKLEELVNLEKRIEEERRRLTEEMVRLRCAAEISVTSTIFRGVDLFVGRTHRRVEEPLKMVTFRLSEEGQVEAGPLRTTTKDE